MDWFTADPHFGHANIIKFCKRPFKTVEEMDQTLIDYWNEVVARGDTVYVLGDFTLGGHEVAVGYFRQLKGHIYVIPGGHDKRWVPRRLDTFRAVEKEIRILPPIWEIRRGKRQLVLCHYPMRSWNGSCHGSYHLHGHAHGNSEPYGLSLDVGVDNHDFRPISMQQVLKEFKRVKRRMNGP